MDDAALRELAKHPERWEAVQEELGSLPQRQFDLLHWRLNWLCKARPKQMPPLGEWFIWFIMSGRGFGKTLCGANWLADEALNDPPGDINNISHVISLTRDDVKQTCFEGPTGLLNVIPSKFIVDYNKSDLIIFLDNGGIIRGFSSEEPDKLRGPQCKRAWCEEVGSWQYDEETWDMMIFGLRLGDKPRVVVTSTPKPRPLVKMLVNHEDRVLVRGSTYENRENLPQKFLDEVLKYEGTKIGRQEIHGELLDLEEMGIIKRSSVRKWPHDKELPDFTYILMSLDTAFTQKTIDKKTFDRDPTACTVWGIFHEPLGEQDIGGGMTQKVALPSVMLLDAWEDWLGLPELIVKVKADKKVRYGAANIPEIKPVWGRALLDSDGREVDLILIEDKGSGISLRQSLEADGILSYPYNPHNEDKLARLHAVSPLFARGRVWAPESKKRLGQFRDWVDPVLDQLCTFAGLNSLKHDDFVDSTTQALKVLEDFGLIKAVDKGGALRELKRAQDAKALDPNNELASDIEEAYNTAHSRMENPYAS